MTKAEDSGSDLQDSRGYWEYVCVKQTAAVEALVEYDFLSTQVEYNLPSQNQRGRSFTGFLPLLTVHFLVFHSSKLIVLLSHLSSLRSLSLMVGGTKVAKRSCNIHRKITLRRPLHWYNIKPWACTLPWCFITPIY